jgi:hypothetical protein
MAKVGVDEEDMTNLNDGTDYDDTDNDTTPEEDAINPHDQNPSKQDIFYEDEEFPTVTQYVYIKIGITELVVSSEGTIRKANDIFSTSKGFVLIGTPYRTYPVEIEKHQIEEYYVHDIVWRVFHGDPPEGWEVRHNMWEAKNGNESYSNALNNLNIYPSTVTYMPSVRAYLPEPDD